VSGRLTEHMDQIRMNLHHRDGGEIFRPDCELK